MRFVTAHFSPLSTAHPLAPSYFLLLGHAHERRPMSCSALLERFIAKSAHREFDPTFVISHRLNLSDGPEAYKKFYNKEGGWLKTFIRPNSDKYVTGEVWSAVHY